jgi:hypothetical protein
MADDESNITPDSDEAFMRSVEMILSRKPTPNTYKYAVIRALVHSVRFSSWDPISSVARGIVIPFERIATHAVSYYWPIVVDYRLRQSIDPAEEPHVMQLIRDETADLALPPNFESWRYVNQHPERHRALVTRCCDPGGSLAEAISRLHTVAYYRVEPKLYKVVGQELHITKSAAEFLVRYQQAIEEMSIAYWVSFTEQMTSSPRLYSKIAGGPSGLWNENARRKYSRILVQLWGDVCFYCGRTARDGPLAMGYLVPFTYALQDRIWNLVLNCDACSSAKGEQTPPNSSVEKVIGRNRELLAFIQRSDIGLGNRDIHELNHFGPRLAEHVRGLIEGCRADGFGTWAGPEHTPTG